MLVPVLIPVGWAYQRQLVLHNGRWVIVHVPVMLYRPDYAWQHRDDNVYRKTEA